MQREKAKTLAILKLAKVDSDKHLSEKDIHDIIGSPMVVNTDEGVLSPLGSLEEVKKKKGWNPINQFLIKPVGKVLRLPGKIVGGVVNVVTSAVSSKDKSASPSE